MPAPVPTAIKLTSVTSPTAYVCSCGGYVAPNTEHNCCFGTLGWTTAPFVVQQPSPTEAARIAAALERIAKALEDMGCCHANTSRNAPGAFGG